jgi:hypothetical protein
VSDELEQLREALREYAAHQSWRCEHPSHWYMVDRAVVPVDDCPCGLLGTLKRLGLDVHDSQRTGTR